MSSAKPVYRGQRSTNNLYGFSLTELLIACATCLLVLAAAVRLLIGHLTASAQQEATLRLQDNWSRAIFLISQDIMESTGACFSDVQTLQINNIQNTAEVITYSVNNDGQLTRTGPPIGSSGELILGEPDQPPQVVTSNVLNFGAENAAFTCGVSPNNSNIGISMTLQAIRNGSVIARYSNQGRAGAGSARILRIQDSGQ